MKQKVMDAMQSFSRALMGPVLFLPIAGMLQAISSVMSNTALVTEGGVVWTLGKFINGGVGAVIGNLGILFCVGIAMSLAKKRKADAAFLALVSYLVWLAANSRWLDVAGLTIAGDTASALYGTGQTICLGYHVTDMGVFLGMILGVVVALVHNRFIDTEFEGAMAMYGNSKFVFVVLLPIVLVMAVVASYVWPVAAAGINALTGVMASAGAFGVFLYGFLNRVLIPTGLHHLVWSPFLYSALGDSMIIGGEQIVGAKPVFLALLSDPSVAMMRDSARFLTYGLMKTFGVIGVAMAFISTAKKEKKAATKAQIIPATLTACLVGVTEPLEFTFLFAAPALWLVYSVLDGLFQMIVYLVGIRVCATNGIIDFLVLTLPAGIGRTRWPLYVLVGLVEIVVMYLVFRFLIVKMNLKTPGREDGEEVTDLAANAAAVKQQIRSGAADARNGSAGRNAGRQRPVYRRDDRTDGKLLPQRQCQRELDAARGPLERRARRILCRGYLAALERVSAHGVCDERLPERTRYGRRIQRHSRHRRRLCLLAGIRTHRAQRSVPPRHGI